MLVASLLTAAAVLYYVLDKGLVKREARERLENIAAAAMLLGFLVVLISWMRS